MKKEKKMPDQSIQIRASPYSEYITTKIIEKILKDV